jgi:glycosyltransferase involved in cell wall biosynthesis
MVKNLYALIVHHYWNRAGGGELVCASFAKVFESIGLKSVLGSMAKIDVSKYPEWFGIDLSRYDKVDLGIKLRAFGLYLRLMGSLIIHRVFKKYHPEAVFTDVPTYKHAINTIKKHNSKLIEYIHFPYEAWFSRKLTQFNLMEDPYIVERYGRFPMNIYFRVFVKLLPFTLRENPFEVADLVFANSMWTANLVRRIHDESPIVLNPPIPPSTGIVEKVKPFDLRDCAVVMVGRFSEEKRYHWVLQEVFPRLKKICDDAKLYIFGATGTRTARAYYARLFELAKSMGFKASATPSIDADVYLVENAPRSVINNVMDRARAFLHATINEHWGIAVAEAMARGLPIVVHKSGGTWSDLASEGFYGLGYTNVEEAVEALAKLVTNSSMWNLYTQKSIEKARELTFNKFIEKSSALVKRIL